MELTEQQQQWLEDLVVKGKVTKNINIVNGKITLILDSMIGSNQLAVEKSMTSIDGAPVYVLHMYALRSLAQSLKAVIVNGITTTFTTTEEALTYLEARPTVIIDAMMNAQSTFEKELKNIISPEIINENFPKTPGTADASNT
jgi:hypothetical protein